MSFTPSVAVDTVNKTTMPISNGNTLYVGGTGEGNYSNIQEAIDNSSDGDIVFVYDESSPYIECIDIDKSINLVGENRDTTVIDGSGSGDVISVSADWVNIKGFSIQYGGSEWPNDAGIDIRSDFNHFSNNLILGNKIGLYTNSSYGNTIIDNDISNNVNGISLYHSSNNTLMGNNITDNHQHGIWLSTSNNNIISRNKISFNGGGIGLYVSTKNTIIGNTITSNYKGSGIGARECYNINNISGNTITYNFHGISYYLASFQNFIYNNISNNQMYGIRLNSVEHINIEGNNIEKNEIGLDSLDCKSIFIVKNNFIKNVNQTFFDFFGVKYDSNYWSNWIGLKIKIPIFQKFPKILYGGFLSGFKFDWHPAKEPYDIEGVI